MKLGEIMVNIFQVVFTLIYFSFLNIGLTIGSILIAILMPLLSSPFAKYIRINHENHYKEMSKSEALIQDTVQGAEVIRAYPVYDMLVHKYQKHLNQIRHYAKKRIRFEELYMKMQIVSTFFGLIFVFSYGGYQVYLGNMDVGAVAAFLVTFERLSRPISELSSSWNQLQTSIASANRIFELQEIPQEVSQSKKKTNSKISKDGFYFEQIHMELNEREIFQDLSLHIEKHKMTVIVGPSGSGKSSMLHLLMGFHSPKQGTIYYDQEPIAVQDPNEWRMRIAYVPQEPFLISGSVIENIQLGKLTATKEEISEVVEKVGINYLIENSSANLDVLDRGGTLSGGEKQRIAIARALLDPNKEILILDEATSNLDVETENIALNAIREFVEKRTFIMVAHKLTTATYADKVVFVEDGNVVEEGTHEELMLLRGRYYKMYNQWENKENVSEN
ncbi:ABC transporter ATP-binding protein [Pseudogracilibacillus sp. SO30301A]|uniref:ABC transporter ATP-binding protein n=1 Tax=Pseudogracilibacillus sp. SO30301A TaxID=3098291 RepID=UPI00300E1EF7